MNLNNRDDDAAILHLLFKRIEALEEQVAELRKPEPLTYPVIDLGLVEGSK